MMKGLLERLNAGEVIIGDGGYVYALEKRGYVKAGPWTPEAAVEHPEAVLQLHREFLRCGSDVVQTFTFYSEDDKLKTRGDDDNATYKVSDINTAACKLARKAAEEVGALVAGGVSKTSLYSRGASKDKVQEIFRKQLKAFEENGVDFLIAEFFDSIEEIEWAIEALKTSGKPICATMCIGPEGDKDDVTPGKCAVRMANAGADVVGINCRFGPGKATKTLQSMKEGLSSAGITKYLMVQPLGFRTPDAQKMGHASLPEAPFALEPRTSTRWEFHKFARAAYDLGARYIGGCCGTEPYHIRAIAEELRDERGKLPPASSKHGIWGAALSLHALPRFQARATRAHWENLNPSCGRRLCSSTSEEGEWHISDEKLIV